MTSTLDTAVVWLVWIGTYTAPVRVVAPQDATLEDLARVAQVAMHDQFQRNVRPEHEEYDRQFWTDAVAAKSVTKVERGDDVHLHPRLAVTPLSAERKDAA